MYIKISLKICPWLSELYSFKKLILKKSDSKNENNYIDYIYYIYIYVYTHKRMKLPFL